MASRPSSYTLFGKPLKMTLDVLVLMCSMEKNKSIDAIQQKLGVANNSDGFMQIKNMYLGMNDTAQDGVFVAGACTAPKSLPDTIGEARSVAVEVFNYINNK